ncbi:hypothetical protein MHBO_001341 [Bonamia ostreae]|uniref:Uncharacterized protein n=1 Tax=Bonamia ostreae TaxID=126728 RepID=A0ABV2AIM4_9EUKA
MISESHFVEVNDFALRLHSLSLSLQGYCNDSERMPRIKISRIFHLRQNMRAPIVKLQIVYNKAQTLMKALQYGKYVSDQMFRLAELLEEKKELSGFLMSKRTGMFRTGKIMDIISEDFY